MLSAIKGKWYTKHYILEIGASNWALITRPFLVWRYMFTGHKTTLTTPLSQMSMCGVKNVQNAIHKS